MGHNKNPLTSPPTMLWRQTSVIASRKIKPNKTFSSKKYPKYCWGKRDWHQLWSSPLPCVERVLDEQIKKIKLKTSETIRGKLCLRHNVYYIRYLECTVGHVRIITHRTYTMSSLTGSTMIGLGSDTGIDTPALPNIAWFISYVRIAIARRFACCRSAFLPLL